MNDSILYMIDEYFLLLIILSEKETSIRCSQITPLPV